VNPGCLLILILIGLFFIVTYWQMILSIVFCIVAVISMLIFWSHLSTQAKIKAVNSSDVVWRTLSKQYAIPLKVGSEKLALKSGKNTNTYVVNLVIPEIDGREIKFNYESEKLTNVKPIEGNSFNPQDYQTLKAISPIVKDILLKIRPQNEELIAKIDELRSLKHLVETSEIYRNKSHLYTRSIATVQASIECGNQLDREYRNFIREALIEEKIATYNPEYLDTLADTRIELQAKCQQVLEQYEQIKLEVAAYDSLKQGIS
jgi:hypothetical protein